MPSFVKSIILLSVAFTGAAALATPYDAARYPRSVDTRVAEPVVALNKRCRYRPSSSASAATSTTAVASSSKVSTPTPAANAASAPSAGQEEEEEEASFAFRRTTRSSKPAPTSTKNPKAAATFAPSEESDDSAPPSSGSFMSGTQSGEGTYFATGLGACGKTTSDSDHIVAVSRLLFDSYPGYNGANPNNNPVCGKKIKATYRGRSTTVTVVDRCEGCGLADLDFTPTAFGDIADHALGRISDVKWTWA